MSQSICKRVINSPGNFGQVWFPAGNNGFQEMIVCFQQELTVLKLKLPTSVHVCGISAPVWGKPNEYYLKLWRYHQSYKYRENSIYNLCALCRNGRKQSISIYLFINILRKWKKIVNINIWMPFFFSITFFKSLNADTQSTKFWPNIFKVLTLTSI